MRRLRTGAPRGHIVLSVQGWPSDWRDTPKPDTIRSQARSVYIEVKPLELVDDFRNFRIERPGQGFFAFLAA
jgi:hypothetical protein